MWIDLLDFKNNLVDKVILLFKFLIIVINIYENIEKCFETKFMKKMKKICILYNGNLWN